MEYFFLIINLGVQKTSALCNFLPEAFIIDRLHLPFCWALVPAFYGHFLLFLSAALRATFDLHLKRGFCIFNAALLSAQPLRPLQANVNLKYLPGMRPWRVVITPVNGRHFVCARHLGEIFTVVTRTANLFRNSASANEKFIKKIFNNQRIRLFFLFGWCVRFVCVRKRWRENAAGSKSWPLSWPVLAQSRSQVNVKHEGLRPLQSLDVPVRQKFYFIFRWICIISSSQCPVQLIKVIDSDTGFPFLFPVWPVLCSNIHTMRVCSWGNRNWTGTASLSVYFFLYFLACSLLFAKSR